MSGSSRRDTLFPLQSQALWGGMVTAFVLGMSIQAIVKRVPKRGMTLALALLVAMPLVGVACGSKAAFSSGHDGATDQASSSDSLVRTGGAGGGTGSGRSGSGGIASGGAGGLGTGGAAKDAGPADVAGDGRGPEDAPVSYDGDAGCAPGYPVNSQRPQGDGCNTCYCESGGQWLCTTLSCPPPADAALDVTVDAKPLPDASCADSGCGSPYDTAPIGDTMCGSRTCGISGVCCSSPCAACMPTAERCASVVCGTQDGGAYDFYPSDCVAAYSGDSTFCGVVNPTTPHSIHYYVCSASMLASPCWAISVATAGGSFCCPGSTF